MGFYSYWANFGPATAGLPGQFLRACSIAYICKRTALLWKIFVRNLFVTKSRNRETNKFYYDAKKEDILLDRKDKYNSKKSKQTSTRKN